MSPPGLALALLALGAKILVDTHHPHPHLFALCPREEAFDLLKAKATLPNSPAAPVAISRQERPACWPAAPSIPGQSKAQSGSLGGGIACRTPCTSFQGASLTCLGTLTKVIGHLGETHSWVWSGQGESQQRKEKGASEARPKLMALSQRGQEQKSSSLPFPAQLLSTPGAPVAPGAEGSHAAGRAVRGTPLGCSLSPAAPPPSPAGQEAALKQACQQPLAAIPARKDSLSH